MDLPVVPINLKAVQPYMKIALEHETRDPVIAYWCRLYALQAGLKIDRKSKESLHFLGSVMDWLEKAKKKLGDNEAITNEVVAQAHIENYALKLFLWADAEDRAGNFNKNVVKSFFTSGIIYDLLQTYGELTEEVLHHRKYAKWKATYIHNCLKNGVTPVAGPLADSENQFDDAILDAPSSTHSQGEPNTPANVPSFPELPRNNWGANENTSTIPSYSNASKPGAHAPPSSPSSFTELSTPSTTSSANFSHIASNGVQLKPEDFHKAQKFCKFAGSALQYEDIPTAVDNLQKALLLLTTGSI